MYFYIKGILWVTLTERVAALKFKRRHQKASSSESSDILGSDLKENIFKIKESLGNTSDLSIRELEFNGQLISFVFLNTLVDRNVLETKVIQQLINEPGGSIINTVSIKEIHKTESFQALINGIVQGKSVMLFEHESYAFLLDTTSFQKRDITEPISEQVIRGPHDGFIENLDGNLSMIRERVKSRNLVVKMSVLGRESDTRVAVLYISTIANEELIKEVERRISYIDVDIVQSPGQLEEYIEDTSLSPFPQILNTERPDRVANNLIDGRVAVLTDCSPSALVMPITFFSFYQTPDDYNSRWYLGSFLRLIRLMSFFISLTLPAIYISIVSFHYEIIPIDLIFNVKGSLEYVPFPPLIEAMIMQFTLELLREASIRLPSPIAQTIGVVGGLVIGTAVVEANLVSNSMIVVVALTAIASFVVPISEMGTSVRLLGFPIMIAASLLGLVGIAFSLMIIVVHLCKLESFGSPYFAPFAPFRLKDFKDTIIRLPLWKMNARPTTPQPQNVERENNSRGWEKHEKE
jgi:spore germination protein KA